jgi:hypothetical protein
MLKRTALVFAAILAIACGAAHADSITVSSGSASASLMFKIVIPVVLKIESTVAQPLVVTEENVRAGYVDGVRRRIAVLSNSGRDYLFTMFLRSPVAKAVVAASRGWESRITEGGTSMRTRANGTRQEHEVVYRIELAPGVKPGVYPWPIAEEVSSI